MAGNFDNFLLRGVLKSRAIRFMFVGTTALAEKGIKAHDADPAAGEIFADALTAAALFSPLLDEGELYSMRWTYPGPAGMIFADVDAKCHVRGIPSEPHLLCQVSPPLSEDLIFGHEPGKIAVTKSCQGKILNSGETTAPLAMPSRDAGFFLSTSDQVESELRTFFRFTADPEHPVHSAFGIMIQALPGCNLEQFDPCRRLLHGDEVTELFSFARGADSPERLLQRILETILLSAVSEDDFAPARGPEPVVSCRCSREKMREALTVLGREELKRLLEEQQTAKIACRFCKAEYQFSHDDFKDFLES